MTSEQLSRYFEQYRETEITFNWQVIKASGLVTSDVYLKVWDRHWPCVIYSCSMAGARVIAEVQRAFSEAVRRANSMAALHFCFKLPNKTRSVTFFVPGRIESLAGYNPQKPDVQFITLVFLQRPSDVLIGVLGSLLEVNANAVRRSEERIVLTPETMEKIGLESRESCVDFGGAPRRCLLRDLSFSGAKILVSGIGEPVGQNHVTLKFVKCEQKEDMVLGGSIVRVEEVEGRNDIVALSIRFSGEPQLGYKQKIHSYFASANKGA